MVLAPRYVALMRMAKGRLIEDRVTFERVCGPQRSHSFICFTYFFKKLLIFNLACMHTYDRHTVPVQPGVGSLTSVLGMELRSPSKAIHAAEPSL